MLKSPEASLYLHSPRDMPGNELLSYVIEHNLGYHHYAEWNSRVNINVIWDELPAPIQTFSDSTQTTKFIVVIPRRLAVSINYSEDSGRFAINLSSLTKVDADELVETLRRKLPKMEALDDSIPVTFWNWSNGSGAQKTTRDIATQDWMDISRNYPEKTRTQLEELFQLKTLSEENGKLILWHGPPGTGKTHGLRSLMQDWNAWATSEYIVDPDVFFDNAAYLMSVLLSRSDDFDLDDLAPSLRKKDKEAGKWRVLICEDTGELLSADAAQRTGQGLSRCLNTVDGLVGQGLKVAIVITTNEKLGKLHEAIRRPGRTHSIISFDSFNKEQAGDWLSQSVERDMTLAELYAAKNNHKISAGQESNNRRAVGFQVR